MDKPRIVRELIRRKQRKVLKYLVEQQEQIIVVLKAPVRFIQRV
jgi:hypothetical protein